MDTRLEVLKLYEQGYRDKEIAIMLNKSFGRIAQIRKEFNLPRNFKFKKKDFLDLHSKGLTDNKIADLLGVSATRISEFRRSLNLISNKSSDINITKVQEQLIIGTVLGDGHLYNYKDTAMLKFDHSLKQKDYLFYKYNIIKNLCNKEPYYLTQKDKRTSKVYEKYSCRTKSLISLKKYRKLFYCPKKQINLEICDLIDTMAVAIHYFDDGYLHKNRYYYIAMYGYSKESVKLYMEMLKYKFNINASCKNGNNLYIKADSIEKFTNLIKPYTVKSMEYKLSL